MGTYISNAQVTAHLPNRTFSGSTSPSTTDIDNWIDEAEAILEGALQSAQIATPITSTQGVKIMRHWLSSAVVGTGRMSFASAGGDGGNKAGEEQIEKFNEKLIDIINRPQLYQQQLGAGSGTTASRQIRSYVVDNTDSKSISDGDFDPTFTTSSEF